ncbi:MAG: ATP-binding cassette domain-containing protein [Oscillospiraceae bacterium]|nr:ATP-binding cassette domain-containing protein [Oscillospiraceae bacterium]
MALICNFQKRLRDFDLNINLQAENGITALLGASGSGKTMALRCIAGLQTPECGSIILENRTLFDSERRIHLPPQARRTGLLFQNYALFPNMTIRQNLLAGARRQKNEQNVLPTAERFGITHLLHAYPQTLSGGEQQRAALARLLLSEPDILLLDEPFSALDVHLRFHLEQELTDILRSFKKPVLLVSHDRGEVFRMAEHVAILHQGKVDAFGSKDAIFAAPPSVHAARLIGWQNISAIRPIDDTHVFALDWNMALFVGAYERSATHVAIRAHDICVNSKENRTSCAVVSKQSSAFSETAVLRLANGAPLVWESEKIPANGHLHIALPQEKLVMLKG